MWIFWLQIFLELNRQTLTLKLLCGDIIWTEFGCFKCWGPRLCLFRVGHLESVTFQLPLNNWLNRISFSTSKDILSIACHEFFSSLLFLRHLIKVDIEFLFLEIKFHFFINVLRSKDFMNDPKGKYYFLPSFLLILSFNFPSIMPGKKHILSLTRSN